MSAPIRSSRIRFGLVCVAVSLAMATAACSTSKESSDPTTTSSGSEATTCVANVADVIARTPDPASADASLPSDLVDSLDAAARRSFTEAATPGAIVAVRTPVGTWVASYGEADPGAHVQMTVDMHQRIGSVTKTFTGTLLLQLAEQGKLSLDDPISKYIAGVPNGDRITLRMLANMTSGVASYTRSTAFTDIYFAHPETVFSPDQLLAVGIAGSPLFEPGTMFDYSNTNTVLLGMVIEQVTGKPIADVYRTQIFEPLGLSQTSWPGDSPDMPTPHSQGYTLQGDAATPGRPSNATNWNPAWGWTAGELISDVDDLLVYGRALGTGQRLLGAEAQTERLLSFPGTAGYGLALGCIDGWVGHTGELPGYNTSVFYDTITDSTVIVETNSDISSGACAESPTLIDDPRDLACSSPATRMFVAISAALGHPFTPLPAK